MSSPPHNQTKQTRTISHATHANTDQNQAKPNKPCNLNKHPLAPTRTPNNRSDPTSNQSADGTRETPAVDSLFCVCHKTLVRCHCEGRQHKTSAKHPTNPSNGTFATHRRDLDTADHHKLRLHLLRHTKTNRSVRGNKRHYRWEVHGYQQRYRRNHNHHSTKRPKRQPLHPKRWHNHHQRSRR